MSIVISGVVHGNTIELKRSPGVPDGQEVEVILRPVGGPPSDGGGFHRSAGALADDPHWDGIMAEIQRERRLERRPQMEGL